MRAPERFSQLIADALARLRIPASQIVDQFAAAQLPPTGNTGSGYTPAPSDHTRITDFDARVTDLVGTLGGFTDPTTNVGDLMVRDSGGVVALPVGTTGQVLTVVGGTWAAASGGSTPTHATFWHDEATITVGAALTRGFNAIYPYGVAAYQSLPANGDTFQQTCVLAAGTYTLNVLATADTNRGIVDWYLDGMLVLAGQDWYATTATMLVQSASITVATSGLHTLSAVVNGKNGASGDYYVALTKYWVG